MKILIKELKNIIQEGVLDGLTTQLSRTIINHIKQEAPSGRIDALIQKINDFNLHVVFQTYGDEKHLRLTQAFYDIEYHELFIRIEVPLPLQVQKLNAFIPKLKEALRHELEHALQQTRKTQSGTHYAEPANTIYSGFPSGSPFKNIENAKTYYLNPQEIEAHVMGLYKIAKTTKTPFLKVLQNKVEEVSKQMQKNKISKSESIKFAIHLYQTWLAYAQKRLSPKVFLLK